MMRLRGRPVDTDVAAWLIWLDLLEVVVGLIVEAWNEKKCKLQLLNIENDKCNV